MLGAHKNLDDLKKIIQTYIEKIIVYEENALRCSLFLLYIRMVGARRDLANPPSPHTTLERITLLSRQYET